MSFYFSNVKQLSLIQNYFNHFYINSHYSQDKPAITSNKDSELIKLLSSGEIIFSQIKIKDNVIRQIAWEINDNQLSQPKRLKAQVGIQISEYEQTYSQMLLEQLRQQQYWEASWMSFKQLMNKRQKNEQQKATINQFLKRPYSEVIIKHYFQEDYQFKNISKEKYESLNCIFLGQPIDVKEFNHFLEEFERGDYSFLYKKQEKLEIFIGRRLKDWQYCKCTYKDPFGRFLDLIKVKIEFVTTCSLAYPAIFRVQKRLEIALDHKYKKQINETNIDISIYDLLFHHYMEEIQAISSHNNYIQMCDQQKDHFQDFIQQFRSYFDLNQSWKSIFLLVTSKYGDRKQDDFFSRQSGNFFINKCFACSQYLYHCSQLYQLQKCLHKVEFIGKAKDVKTKMRQIKSNICALLNGEGGILLFDFKRKNNSITPIGQFYATSDDFERFMNAIVNCLSEINPKPILNKEIFIQFVPLADTANDFNEEIISQKKMKFIQGLYVTRVIVKNPNNIAYYWNMKQNIVFSDYGNESQFDGKRHIIGKDLQSNVRAMNNISRNFSQHQQQNDEIIDNEELKLTNKMKESIVSVNEFSKKTVFGKANWISQRIFRMTELKESLKALKVSPKIQGKDYLSKDSTHMKQLKLNILKI